jgi:hypothetical protein
MRHHVVRASLLTLLLSFAPVTASAQDPLLEPGFADIPAFLLDHLRRNATLADLLEKLSRGLQRVDLDGNGLDAQDVELDQQIERAQFRAIMLQQIVANDLDGNGEVTLAEATRAALHQMRGGGSDKDELAIQKQAAQLAAVVMGRDTNADGVVTIAEALQAMPPEKKPRHSRFPPADELLALDPNQDGRLTSEELDKVASRVFAAADYDHDGTISDSEDKMLNAAREFQRQMQQYLPCDPPKPGAADLVAILGMYTGELQPTVTVAGQDKRTQLVPVKIEPGDQPLYLVLTSFRQVIWLFQGATDRLVRVVIIRSGYREMLPETPGNGVIGLDAAKVTFLPQQSCGWYFTKTDSDKAKLVAAMFERALGRKIDALHGIEYAKAVAMPSGITLDKNKTNASVATGEEVVIAPGQGSTVQIIRGDRAQDLATVEEWWAGASSLVTVDPAVVLAPGKVQPYEVLPGEYGLQQLLDAGNLERSEGKYRIVKPFARFPAELTGHAGGVTFILPEGTPMPAGDAGHSQIILEKKSTQ